MEILNNANVRLFMESKHDTRGGKDIIDIMTPYLSSGFEIIGEEKSTSNFYSSAYVLKRGMEIRYFHENRINKYVLTLYYKEVHIA